MGAKLGGYRLEALLGRGGMGLVYRAEDVRLGRKVALKLLSSELAQDGRFRARFLAESRLAASIDHANIVPIYEAGEAEGVLYIAMRHVEGTDLRALIRREGALDAERAVGLVAQLGDALDAASARGLVHRDVKPSNALVTVEGASEHVYLADFGLTKHVATYAGRGSSEQLVGTVDYVAPEQIRGEVVDGRADLYSLGCVLFECLVGEPPFARRSDVAVIYAHLEEEAMPPSELRPGVPRALDAVLARALAKDPRARWQTGAELAAAARAALAGTTGGSTLLRRMGLRRSHRAVLALGVAALVGAGTAALVASRPGGGAARVRTGANAVAVVNPDTGSVTAELPLDASPSQMVTGAGAVWVANTDAQTVARIDPATRTVRQTIPVGGAPSAIAYGGGAVWVVNSLDGTVSRIAPEINEVVATLGVGNGPIAVCGGSGAIWVANADDRTLSRIDPLSDRVSAIIALDASPTALACGGGAVWASSESAGVVWEIRPASDAVVGSIGVGAGAGGEAFGRGALWVVNPLAGTVSEIDPRRGAVAATVAVGAADGPAHVDVGTSGVWVSNEFAGTLARIDPRRGVLTRTVTVGNRPQGLALVDGAVWVGLRASGARHRGGTLRVVTQQQFTRGHLDPANAAIAFTGQVLSLTNDGLMAFRRAGGREGWKLVPDLAESLPTVTNDGRSYLFHLRRGIRYSNGALVRPEDIRRELEHLWAGSFPGAGFYAGILGAGRCVQRRRACDLSRGIVIDDAAGTIVFHLIRPDPEFLDKLALPLAIAVPRGTRFGGPPPATGPYAVARVRPWRELDLVRNPHFRPWSSAAKPDGYVDAITVRFGVDPARGLREVEHGDADYMASPLPRLPRTGLDRLFARYAAQLHVSTQFGLTFFLLNARVAPFDDINARRAVNYALDRRALAAFDGGPRGARPTCQILPPNFPGYEPYCPYTAQPAADGVWRAPDLQLARRLVARSHTRGMRVTVWADDPGETRAGRFLVRLLRDLGYRASLRTLPLDTYFSYVWDSRHRVQVAAQGFGADYPAASDFLLPSFGCRAFVPNDPMNANASGFCDHAADRLIDAALRLQPTAQAAANALWARVDHRLVDQAAVLPVSNPRVTDFVSRRVGGYQRSPEWGVLLDQLWVR